MLRRMVLLALLTLAVASAKTFKFKIPEAAYAGAIKLKSGEYTLEVNGSNVVLMDQAGRPIDVRAKVEKAEYELSFTAVYLSRDDGITRIEWIYLENRKQRVVFE